MVVWTDSEVLEIVRTVQTENCSSVRGFIVESLLLYLLVILTPISSKLLSLRSQAVLNSLKHGVKVFLASL